MEELDRGQCGVEYVAQLRPVLLRAPHQKDCAMLILSRRAEQQIVFPHLGIRINVLQVKGQLVKLGVDAPKAVRVLRDELAERPQDLAAASPAERLRDHELRNALNLLNLKIQSLQSRIDRGEELAADDVLDSLLARYSAMDHSFDTGTIVPQNAGRPGRLLVVEDSDNERQLMAYLLASHGFDVQVAPDGVAALNQLQAAERLPDFVLMDVEMPGSGGLETLLQIRSSEALRGLPVFAVTGTARNPDNEPVGHGWDGWFRKPLDVSALVSRLNSDLAIAEPTLGV